MQLHPQPSIGRLLAMSRLLRGIFWNTFSIQKVTKLISMHASTAFYSLASSTCTWILRISLSLRSRECDAMKKLRSRREIFSRSMPHRNKNRSSLEKSLNKLMRGKSKSLSSVSDAHEYMKNILATWSHTCINTSSKMKLRPSYISHAGCAAL